MQGRTGSWPGGLSVGWGGATDSERPSVCLRRPALHVCVVCEFLLASFMGEVCHFDTGLAFISWN